MANVILTMKIMPEGVEVDLVKTGKEVKERINGFIGNDEIKVEIVDVAFGLKAVQFMFSMDEDKGDTDGLEQSIQNINGVKSVEVVDVRRAIG